MHKQTHMKTKTLNSKQHAHKYKIKNLKSGFCIVDGKWMKEKQKQYHHLKISKIQKVFCVIQWMSESDRLCLQINMLEKAQWERERGLGFCYLELGGLEAGLRKEELGFSGFGCDWIYIRTQRRKMEKSWRAISSIREKKVHGLICVTAGLQHWVWANEAR